VIKFATRVLDSTYGFEAFLGDNYAERKYFEDEERPTPKQTWSCGHVNVESLLNKHLTDEEKVRFVEAVNKIGWTLVSPGDF